MMHQKTMHHYARFAAMMLLSFLAMYAFMYAMVDGPDHVHPNLNNAYMAGLMVAPMAVFEIALMGMMYPSKQANRWIVAGGLLLLLLCWGAIRTQAAVGDREFLRSMIPHHSGAILMCRQATIADARIRQLCGEIIRNQRAEIDRMEAILRQLP